MFWVCFFNTGNHPCCRFLLVLFDCLNWIHIKLTVSVHVKQKFCAKETNSLNDTTQWNVQKNVQWMTGEWRGTTGKGSPKTFAFSKWSNITHINTTSLTQELLRTLGKHWKQLSFLYNHFAFICMEIQISTFSFVMKLLLLRVYWWATFFLSLFYILFQIILT